jgi:hypothetical protein
MARKPKIRLRKGQPIQTTATGLEIPVPTRRTFIRDLRKTAKFDDLSGDGKGSAPKQ